jgi:hypothetical protein
MWCRFWSIGITQTGTCHGRSAVLAMFKTWTARLSDVQTDLGALSFQASRPLDQTPIAAE